MKTFKLSRKQLTYNKYNLLYTSKGLNIKKIKKYKGTTLKEITSEIKKLKETKKVKIKLSGKAKENRINKELIQKNNFNLLFKRIFKNTKKTLTPTLKNIFFKKLEESDDKYTLKLMTKINDSLEEKFIYLNDTSIEYLSNILSNGFIVDTQKIYGSDYFNVLNVSDIQSVEVIKIDNPNKKNKTSTVKFFPLVNTTVIDLKKYQIYNQEQCDNNKNNEHCLFHSLAQAGVKESILNSIKLQYIKNTHIKKTDLKKIAKNIGINMTIFTIDKDRLEQTKIKINEDEKNIKLGIFENHIFNYELTKYSIFSIDNYDIIKDKKDFNTIYKKDTVTSKPKVKYIRGDIRKITSLSLVKKLYDKNKFKKLDLSNFPEANLHKETKDNIFLDNIINEQRIFGKNKDINEKELNIIYADCETFVHSKLHELYLLGWVSHNNDTVKIYDTESFDIPNELPGQSLINKFIKDITRNGTKKNTIIYFHNLKYDYTILEKYLNIRAICKKDGFVYSVTISYKNIKIELRDSLKMIPISLKNFGPSFSLPNNLRKKEAINYTYYTKDNHNKRAATNIYRKNLSKQDKKIFDEIIIKDPTYSNLEKTFDPLEYYKTYLRLDCLVLKAGMKKFNETILKITDNKIQIYNYLTISSLTDNFMRISKCYDNVYEVKGNLRDYIAKSVIGGRVWCNPKYVLKLIEKKIADLDGVSLYPSAIDELCQKGLPCGMAQRFKKDDIMNWKQKFFAVMTVKITKVNKILQTPMIVNKTINGAEYLNIPPEKPVIINSITLEDYINFHKIEYEILDGVYWDNGGNTHMGTVTRNLFQERLKAKEAKNEPLSNVIKLMLNSSYGKTITSKSNDKITIVNEKKPVFDKVSKSWSICERTNMKNYIYKNFNIIKSHRKINENTFEFETNESDDSYNRGHIGSAILSTSKRLMNRIFNIASTKNCPIYYTDTDSIHCNYDDMKIISDQFKIDYNKKLIGKQLGQFHNDFKMEGAGKGEQIHSNKLLVLGKKAYIDELESKDKDGNVITDYHIRMKGVSLEGIIHEAKKYEDGFMGIYKKLASGCKIQFNMNPFNIQENKHKVAFQFGDGFVKTKDTFFRELQF